MKNVKKILIITVLFMVVTIFIGHVVFAEELQDCLVDKIEDTEEFKKWEALPDEEKEKVIQPANFVVPKTKIETKNPINIVDALSALYEKKYDLRDIISNNLVVKNQGRTDTCWTFAGIAMLETNLAMRDYNNNLGTSKVYDYSERHMDYATSRTFLNNKLNEYGFGRDPTSAAPTA